MNTGTNDKPSCPGYGCPIETCVETCVSYREATEVKTIYLKDRQHVSETKLSFIFIVITWSLLNHPCMITNPSTLFR